MKTRLSFLQFAAAAVLGASAFGQVLYEEGFDSQAAASVQVNMGVDAPVAFVDYSNFTLGAVMHQIPEAPNMIPGSAPTRGVVMQANLNDGAGTASNLIALDDEAELALFSGNYTVTFDMYLSVDPSADAGSAGTTEQGGFGIGTDGSLILSRINRNSSPTGTWGWIAAEGGYGSEDAVIYDNGTRLDLLNNVGNATIFEEAFPNGSPLPLAPNGTWTEVEVTVLDGQVTVKYNGVEFFNVASASTDGSAVLLYEDPFGSLSFSQDYQFGVFDNWKIEVAVPPTLIIEQGGLFAPVNEDAATSMGSFTLTNENATAITVSEINFGGTDAAAFGLDTALPLVIPANGSATVDLTFTASGATGIKSATIEFVSDDTIDPSIILGIEAIFADALLAHYKLDETSGNVVVEASGNAPDGRLTITDPVLYSQTGLAGGTSLGFQAAQFPPGGNFATMTPLHVPTTSISMWIRPEMGDSGEDTLFNRDPGFTGADLIYGCFLDDLGGLTLRTGGEITLQSAAGLIEDGDTYHVVITHLDEDGFGNETATRSRMYINGVMVDENTAPKGFDAYPSNASTESFYLATRSAAGTGYDGLIDDLQIYSIELTPLQVGNMFAAPGITAFDDVPDLTFTDISYNPATREVSLTWVSIPGATYILEDSGNLQAWNELNDSIESQGLTTTETFIADPADVRFYRAYPQE